MQTTPHSTTSAAGRPVTGLVARLDEHIPHWGPQLVVLVAIVLQLGLPDELAIGPRWLLPACEGALLIALALASPNRRWRHSRRRRRIALALTGLVSLTNIISLVLLVHYLLVGGKAGGRPLIGAGFLLWITNVLLFGIWYWELDRGGPIARNEGLSVNPDFLFPQMLSPRWAPEHWAPRLVDYLYVSFTNATAFSPTDTMPLSPQAKWLMSTQSIVSLITVALVVARAVNILS